MKIKYAYPAVFKKEETGYFVNFPDIEPCYTEGETFEEAVVMAKDVLESRIEVALERGESLPPPSDANNLKGIGDKIMLIAVSVNDIKEQRRMII